MTDYRARRMAAFRRPEPDAEPSVATALSRDVLDPAATDFAFLSDESQAELRRNLNKYLGSDTIALLDDANVTDIHRNPNGETFVNRLTGPPQHLDVIQSDDEARLLIGLVDAAYGGSLTGRKPYTSRALPWFNARFSGAVPPRSTRPMWSIRVFNRSRFTLQSYVDTRRATPQTLAAIRWVIEKNKNILIVGSQGHGKTSFAGAVLDEIPTIHSEVRFGIIQDVNELAPAHPNSYSFFADPDVPNSTFADLIKAGLRHGATSLSLGELREQAFALLDAWSTGTEHTGISTIHGQTSHMGLRRLELLLRRDDAVDSIDQSVREAIAEAIGAIVVIGTNAAGERGRILSVERIESCSPTGYRCEPIRPELPSRAG